MKIQILIITGFFLLPKALLAQVDFSASETQGCGTLDVDFTNESNPPGSSFYWDFGNGETSDKENPSIIYLNPGVYDVSLSVDGGPAEIKSAYITVHAKPAPDFTAGPILADCAPLNVSFSGSAGSSTITSWYWDFGDGNSSSVQNPSHIYNSQNNFTVALLVVDNNNCQGSVFKTNYVTVYKPEANFDADNKYACEGNLTTNFINNSTYLGTSPSYYWEFGDGSTSILTNPSHTYTDNGHYGVRLTITDQYTCTHSKEIKDFAILEDVTAGFTTIYDTVCPGVSFQFTNTSSNANSFSWDFGDSTYSTAKNPWHTYQETGNYLVTLNVSNSGSCSETYSHMINVQKVVAGFTLSDYFSCSLPVSIKYNNTSINGYTYNWRFGNTLTSSEFSPTIQYLAEGTYIDTLIVTSKYGCTDTYVSDSSLLILVPNAYCTPNLFERKNESEGCIPLTVNFKDQTKYNTNRDYIDKWNWNFGDGTTSNQQNPSHTYTKIGIFPVTFEITTKNGCKSITNVQTRTGDVQKANFSKTSPDTICASQKVQFTDLSNDAELINGWYWKFGDGTISTKQNPEHSFKGVGSMDVTLLAYYNGCPAKLEKKNFIYVKGPYAEVNYTINCDIPYNPSFTAKLLEGTSFSWDFGDGSPFNSTNLSPTHTYSGRGTYNLKFHSDNPSNSCTYDIQQDVIITDVKANFTTDKNIGCVNMNLTLNSSASVDVSTFSYSTTSRKYLWNFGDNTPMIHTNEPLINHKFTKRGTFPVTLTVKDIHGCEDVLIKNIKTYQPVIDFEANTFTGCKPMTVDFTNNTVIDTTITQWLWNFGDGNTSSEINPSHIYNEFGSYNVSLQAKNILGCTSFLEKEKYIKASKPSPDFYSSDQTICINTQVKFTSESKQNIADYLWDFGDGTTSTQANPTHTYLNNGQYNVSLSLIDVAGCDSSSTAYNYIDVQSLPVADFIGDDLFTNCFPLLVNFSDRSTHPNLAYWHWDFGDGAAADIKNPLHIYNKPGDFDISLTAKSSYGCSDFIEKTAYVHVGGPYADIIAEDTICKSIQTTLIAINKINVDQIKWFFDNGVTVEGDTANHIYNKVGMVYPVLLLTVDDAQTCDKYFTDSIYINELVAEINANDDDFIGCRPFEIAFTCNSDKAISWSWNFGDGTISDEKMPFHVFVEPGQYTTQLIISDNIGCYDTTEANITVHPLPELTISKDSLICTGDSIQLEATGAVQYEWIPNYGLTNNLISNPIGFPKYSTSYTLLAVDSNNCFNSALVNIFVQQKPVVNIPDTAVIIGEPVILNAFSPDIASYNWSSNYNIDCKDCPSIEVKPEEPTRFYLTYTDTSNCFTLDYQVFIDVIEAYTVDLPKAFTPNGDGINDMIYVRGWGIKELLEFKIFNRFGEKVFESNDINHGWDGYIKGRSQDTETFTYIVRVKTYDNNIISKTGTIKLLK